MGLNRYAKRRDANEPDIVEALRAIGCTIIQCDAVDLVVGYQGVNHLIEVKTKTGKLKDSQLALQATWRGQYSIARTVDEALKIVTGENNHRGVK
jgi:Holliday junction resolvase-like predicted endonuclease